MAAATRRISHGPPAPTIGLPGDFERKFGELATVFNNGRVEFMGLLFGSSRGGVFDVTDLLVPNHFSSSANCEMLDSEGQNVRVSTYAARNQVDQIGWVHTHHIHPNLPSETDVSNHVQSFCLGA